ncbi:uncharacterized protein BX664DRAFT_65195 [Halteromyces radiatus]|uniref:uncharacterized protein n=1 Tax=Halteromyces radiatus TaxID=101107 RepID=UPI00221E8411|nr:uncharacterized protein BX664DRAFT_65195 [Halteromyces radiatus]KAI8096729.1 hypothetical protein BX664DRAFT_65195 [Halteromyces radiatus]
MYSTVIKAPTRWSLLPWSATSTLSSSTNIFVVMSSIQTIARSILQQHQQNGSRFSSVDAVLTFTEFRTKYGTYRDTKLTDDDLWLLLRYMNSQFGLAVEPNIRGYGQLHVAIKFPEYSDVYYSAVPTTTTTTTTSAMMTTSATTTRMILSPAEINESDKAIISLKTTCKALHDQVDDLQTKMEELIKLSTQYSSKKQTPQALYTLKKKHLVEQILNRRLKSLETMETLLLKIEASHNDKQIIQAFNVGVVILKQMFNNSDLTVTNIDETMLKMQNTLEEQKRVEDAITDGTNQVMDLYDESSIVMDDEPVLHDTGLQKEKRTREVMNDEDYTSIIADDNNNDEYKELVTLSPPPSTAPNSELARLHSVLSTLPQAPILPPRSKQRRRLQQLA